MSHDHCQSKEATPRWGYHPAHGGRLFALAPGAALPDGWSDVPHVGQHPHDVERGLEPPRAGEDIATEAPARRRPGRPRKIALNTAMLA